MHKVIASGTQALADGIHRLGKKTELGESQREQCYTRSDRGGLLDPELVAVHLPSVLVARGHRNAAVPRAGRRPRVLRRQASAPAPYFSSLLSSSLPHSLCPLQFRHGRPKTGARRLGSPSSASHQIWSFFAGSIQPRADLLRSRRPPPSLPSSAPSPAGAMPNLCIDLILETNELVSLPLT